VGLLGDNGAGKSTLIKCVSGVYHPEEGAITFDGKPAEFATPMDARRVGIETIYQDLALANNLDVGANIFSRPRGEEAAPRRTRPDARCPADARDGSPIIANSPNRFNLSFTGSLSSAKHSFPLVA